MEVIKARIERDQEIFDSPMSGEIGSLRGLPSVEEFARWQERAARGQNILG